MLNRPGLICLALALITFGVYAPVLQNDFVNFDDNIYVTENPQVQAGLTAGGVAWAFSSAGYASNWHPLTWLTHMLDCQLFGLKPGGHHATNVLFHAANTVLLFLLLLRMTGATWRSALVAALFAWHPLHVESVAWVSERKDVLSAFFCLQTLFMYVRYAEQPKIEKAKGKRFYALALVLFACGLMSKPMLVTVPLVMLLMDYWPLRRISDARFAISGPTVEPPSGMGQVSLRQALLEKAPFLGLAVISSVVTVAAQHAGGSVASLSRLPVLTRVSMAMVSYGRYVAKTFWPENLSAYYPPVAGWPSWMILGSAIFLAAMCVYVWRTRRNHPYLAVGWFWFLVMLLPVIGLVQVGTQAMADRYTYLPAIGLFIMVAWELEQRVRGQLPLKWAVGGASAVALAACLLMTRERIFDWRNSGTLFEQSLRVAPVNNFMANALLGSWLNDRGEFAKAEPHFVEAVKIAPTFPIAQYGMGRCLEARRDWTNAAGCFNRAIENSPSYADAHRELGQVLSQQGKVEDALGQFDTALRLAPKDAAAHFGRGAVFMIKGQSDLAVADFAEAVRLKPDWPAALNNLAWVRATSPDDKIRNGAQAIQLAEHACQLTGNKQALFIGTLAAAYAEAGRFKEAVAAGEKACDLAATTGEKQIAARNLQLLELYRANKPYHEPAQQLNQH